MELENFTREYWKVELPKVFIKDNDILVFRFASLDDRNWVLENGPWLFRGSKPLILILKEWKVGGSHQLG